MDLDGTPPGAPLSSQTLETIQPPASAASKSEIASRPIQASPCSASGPAFCPASCPASDPEPCASARRLR